MAEENGRTSFQENIVRVGLFVIARGVSLEAMPETVRLPRNDVKSYLTVCIIGKILEMNSKVSQSKGFEERKVNRDKPLVSIVTPVLNGIKYLEICIQNVLNQTYAHIEHIFVDGGSTDGTLEILLEYKARYPDRIRFISEPDRGVGDALNKGIKMARGEILGWLDTNDVYEPDAVMTAVEFFKLNPNAYFVFGGCNIINEAGEVIGELAIRDGNFKDVINGKEYISLSAAFYKREVLDRVGPFNTLGNNFDFWIRVAQQFPMHRVDKTLCNWRSHKDNIGFSKGARNMEIIRQKVREDYLLCR